MKALVLIFFLFFLSPNVYALSFADISLEELYIRSSEVADVKIINATLVEYSGEEKSLFCGFDYEAVVINSFKGKREKIMFRTHSSLYVGYSYLIFFNDQYADAGISFLSMGSNDNTSYEKCSAEAPDLFTSSMSGDIFEFDPIAEIFIEGKWLKHDVDHLKIPNDIETKFIDFNDAKISEDYFLSYNLISWIGLKKYLDSFKLQYNISK